MSGLPSLLNGYGICSAAVARSKSYDSGLILLGVPLKRLTTKIVPESGHQDMV